MSDELEIEGGFFEEAGINVSDLPTDPFGFGNDFWPVVVVEVGPTKLTQGKDKIGMMVKFAVDHPQFQGHFVSKQLGNGNWYRLPVPMKLRGQIPWDPDGADEKRANFLLNQLFTALGFKADEIAKVNGPKMIGKRMLTKIKATTDENGFWQFRLNSPKTIGENNSGDQNWSGGSKSAPAQNGGAKSAADLMREELGDA